MEKKVKELSIRQPCLTELLEELPQQQLTLDEKYRRCIELAGEAKRGKSGFGAVFDVDFADGTSQIFEGRNQRKRPGKYASGGYSEHAENVVVSDALEYAKLHNTEIVRARMYLAGLLEGAPYIYKEPAYACVMCSAQMRNSLPEDTEILLPAQGGKWSAINPAQAYESALSIRRSRKNAGEFRKGNSLLHAKGRVK